MFDTYCTCRACPPESCLPVPNFPSSLVEVERHPSPPRPWRRPRPRCRSRRLLLYLDFDFLTPLSPPPRRLSRPLVSRLRRQQGEVTGGFPRQRKEAFACWRRWRCPAGTGTTQHNEEPNPGGEREGEGGRGWVTYVDVGFTPHALHEPAPGEKPTPRRRQSRSHTN